MSKKQVFLHVGCGAAFKDTTTRGFNRDEWQELRLDIDANAEPDIVASMTDMSMIKSASMDALFSSHNIEHLYRHEVLVALGEFKRVLKPKGFAIVTCPDLQKVCELVAKGMLDEPFYVSPMGPVMPLDVIYGYSPSIARGATSMAHRTGYTQKSLYKLLQQAGFAASMVYRSPVFPYNLWAVATPALVTQEFLNDLIANHFPELASHQLKLAA